jgi:hypothetical protein
MNRTATALVVILVVVFCLGGADLLVRAFFYPITPALAALALVVVSVRATVRNPGTVQYLLAIVVIAVSLVSLWSVKRMVVDGALGTYLPYWGVPAIAPVAILQHALSAHRHMRPRKARNRRRINRSPVHPPNCGARCYAR